MDESGSRSCPLAVRPMSLWGCVTGHKNMSGRERRDQGSRGSQNYCAGGLLRLQETSLSVPGAPRVRSLFKYRMDSPSLQLLATAAVLCSGATSNKSAPPFLSVACTRAPLPLLRCKPNPPAVSSVSPRMTYCVSRLLLKPLTTVSELKKKCKI